jgi:glycosyltransferase involved in cell wall biosynthesis
MKISAVLPTYNRAGLLTRALNSVFAQTRPVDEIVVVDDGSTDETRHTVSQIGGQLRYVYQENRGLAAARNAGIKVATGDWIALLDDDDVWLPDKTRKQEEAIRSYPHAALVYSSFWFENELGQRTLRQVPEPSDLWPSLRWINLLAAPTVMLRKDAVLELGAFDSSIRVCEDWDLWVRLRARYPFASVPEPLVVCYQTAGSLSKDIDYMLATSERILETTLLSGLNGLERRICRRRIRSSQLFAAAITAKETRSPRELSLLGRSLLQWPSPGFLPLRYAAAARLLLGNRMYARLQTPIRKLARRRHVNSST